MKIDGITLDHDLVWSDEYNFTQGVGLAERTLYGNLIVQTGRITGGRPLTLVGDATHGWQKRSTVIALQALVNSNPGGTFEVEMPDLTTKMAMFRNEEPPVMEFTPITVATAPGNDFWYYGTIKMRILD